MYPSMFTQVSHFLLEKGLITPKMKQIVIQRGARVAGTDPRDYREAAMLGHLAWMVGELPPEIIDRLMEKGGSFEVVRYARCIHKRVPKYEQEIAQSPQAIPYAIYVLKLEEEDVPAWVQSMKEQAR